MASREKRERPRTGGSDRKLMRTAYEVVSWSFVYPESLHESSFRRETSTLLPELARTVDRPAADHLARFLEAFENVGPDHYINTLELEPTCPLYLGHYVFDEPSTCRDIADADRNQYMVELAGIYEHYGWAIEDELPDFVPAMAEFLGMTLDHREDTLRRDFLERFVELLPEMIRHFEDHGTPYQYPLRALYRIAIADLEAASNGQHLENGGER